MKQLNFRFAVIMTVYGAAVFLLYRDEVLGVALSPLAVLTARITAFLLHRIGLPAQREEALLSHPDGFSYEVAYTCTGFLPAVTFIVCLAASSGPVRAKLAGIAWGVPALIAVNLLRLVHLYYLGVHMPSAFALAHEVVWEVLLAITFVGLWTVWLRRVQPMPLHPVPPDPAASRDTVNPEGNRTHSPASDRPPSPSAPRSRWSRRWPARAER